MKKSVLAAVVISSLACGYGVVQAWSEPGWDEPYDPPAYYSETEVSVRDSEPSPFALKDLAEQGGNVYDPARHKQNEETLASDINWYEKLMESLGYEITNTQPVDAEFMDKCAADITDLLDDTKNLQEANTAMAEQIAESENFRYYDRYDEDDNDYDKETQLQEIQEAYAAYGEVARGVLATSEKEDALLNRLMAAGAGAAGNLQAEQVIAYTQALESVEVARRNLLLSTMANMKALKQRIKHDEDLEYQRNVQVAQVRFEDPYHRTEKEKTAYQRPEGKGFVSF